MATHTVDGKNEANIAARIAETHLSKELKTLIEKCVVKHEESRPNGIRLNLR